MKAFALLLVTCLLAACETVSSPPPAAPRGTPLGDSGIRVSGEVQTGAAYSPR